MDPIARHLLPVQIDKELSAAYLDYSMSVIIGRALPDVRDGLKPVHRRILYAMWREGLRANHRYSKCAGVVGEVLKKYHPHGDMAVYDALVRMAQPWNQRYLLVDGQGNFGSVDGDNAAAYRYTECRMTRLAEQLLADIDKETVNFVPNYDGATEEPEVLPAAYPNLLVNGAEGIAVGMATKIPPHNLKEVIDGALAILDNPDVSVVELMRLIPGPDFPTAGTIHGRDGIFEAYTTGRGKISVRGHVEFEEVDHREAIIITELPYQVNKARFQEHIVELVREKRLEGIHAVRDESDRQGMRVVIELKRDAVRDVLLNNLYKHTDLQNTFGVILLAIVNQRPQVLTLKQMLELYLAHRREVTLRRTRFDLRKAQERAHILEGLRIALDHIDAVIATIRASRTTEEARERLVTNFGLSVIQAQAILEMRLQRLTGLERDKLEEEYKELCTLIDWLKSILASEEKLKQVVRDELSAVREQFQDARRTRIVADQGSLTLHDLVAEEDQVVTVSRLGYIKRTSLTEYRMQRRGGSGKTGMTTRDEDFVADIFIANTHSSLLCFTNRGRVYQVPVLEVPESGPASRGKPLVNLINLGSEEKIAAVVPVRDFKGDMDLVFVTRRGMIKRTELAAYANRRAGGLEACDVMEDDELLMVRMAGRTTQLMLTSRNGKSVRFDGDQIRPLSRIARGVKGMELKEGDELVSLSVLPPEGTGLVLTATSGGYGKRTPQTEYPVQNRGGLGVIDIETGERNGSVVASMVVEDDDQVMLITDTGRVIRTGVSGIRVVSRNSKGVRLMRLDEGERVVGITHIPASQANSEPGEGVAADAGEAEAASEGEAASETEAVAETEAASDGTADAVTGGESGE